MKDKGEGRREKGEGKGERRKEKGERRRESSRSSVTAPANLGRSRNSSPEPPRESEKYES
jgi:hypothetical protein